MRIAIIGRTEVLYRTALRLRESRHEITCIFTAKEAPEYTRTAADFKVLSELWNVPFAQGPRIVEYLEFLKASSSDIAVSINYPSVVPQEVVDVFPLGILNAHGGDLPRYQGNACQAWAILNGEERIGLCIHKMVGGELDSGDIIARDYLPNDHTTKITSVLNWMAARVPELMVEGVQRLARNPTFVLERQSKDQKHALRCYPRKPDDGRIDWTKPAIDVLRLINASNKPYAGAFCDFEGERLIIWDAELVNDGEVFCAVPGQVTTIHEDSINIACQGGKLKILLVEYRGNVCAPSSLIKSIRSRLA